MNRNLGTAMRTKLTAETSKSTTDLDELGGDGMAGAQSEMKQDDTVKKVTVALGLRPCVPHAPVESMRLARPPSGRPQRSRHTR